jgi:hypothetical protein
MVLSIPAGGVGGASKLTAMSQIDAQLPPVIES